jgi:hypothetical protein
VSTSDCRSASCIAIADLSDGTRASFRELHDSQPIAKTYPKFSTEDRARWKAASGAAAWPTSALPRNRTLLERPVFVCFVPRVAVCGQAGAHSRHRKTGSWRSIRRLRSAWLQRYHRAYMPRRCPCTTPLADRSGVRHASLPPSMRRSLSGFSTAVWLISRRHRRKASSTIA